MRRRLVVPLRWVHGGYSDELRLCQDYGLFAFTEPPPEPASTPVAAPSNATRVCAQPDASVDAAVDGEQEAAVGGAGDALSQKSLERLEAELIQSGGQSQVVAGLLAKLRAASKSKPSAAAASTEAPLGAKGDGGRLVAGCGGNTGGANGGTGGSSKVRRATAAAGASAVTCRVRDFVYFHADPDGAMRQKDGEVAGVVLSAALEAKQQARSHLVRSLNILSASNLVALAAEVRRGCGGADGGAMVEALAPRQDGGQGSAKADRWIQAEGLRLAVRPGALGDEEPVDELLHALDVIANGRFLLRPRGGCSREGTDVWSEAGWLGSAGQEIALVCPAAALRVAAFACADLVASSLETALLAAYARRKCAPQADMHEPASKYGAAAQLSQLVAWWSSPGSGHNLQLARILVALAGSLRGMDAPGSAATGALGLLQSFMLHLARTQSSSERRCGHRADAAAAMCRGQDDLPWLDALVPTCRPDADSAGRREECLLALLGRLQLVSCEALSPEFAGVVEDLYVRLQQARADTMAEAVQQEEASERLRQERAREKKALQKQRKRAKDKAKKAARAACDGDGDRDPRPQPHAARPGALADAARAGESNPHAPHARAGAVPGEEQETGPGGMALPAPAALDAWRTLIKAYCVREAASMRVKMVWETPLSVARAAVAQMVTAAWQAISAKRVAHAKSLRRLRKSQQQQTPVDDCSKQQQQQVDLLLKANDRACSGREGERDLGGGGSGVMDKGRADDSLLSRSSSVETVHSLSTASWSSFAAREHELEQAWRASPSALATTAVLSSMGGSGGYAWASERDLDQERARGLMQLETAHAHAHERERERDAVGLRSPGGDGYGGINFGHEAYPHAYASVGPLPPSKQLPSSQYANLHAPPSPLLALPPQRYAASAHHTGALQGASASVSPHLLKAQCYAHSPRGGGGGLPVGQLHAPWQQLGRAETTRAAMQDMREMMGDGRGMCERDRGREVQRPGLEGGVGGGGGGGRWREASSASSSGREVPLDHATPPRADCADHALPQQHGPAHPPLSDIIFAAQTSPLHTARPMDWYRGARGGGAGGEGYGALAWSCGLNEDGQGLEEGSWAHRDKAGKAGTAVAAMQPAARPGVDCPGLPSLFPAVQAGGGGAHAHALASPPGCGERGGESPGWSGPHASGGAWLAGSSPGALAGPADTSSWAREVYGEVPPLHYGDTYLDYADQMVYPHLAQDGGPGPHAAHSQHAHSPYSADHAWLYEFEDWLAHGAPSQTASSLSEESLLRCCQPQSAATAQQLASRCHALDVCCHIMLRKPPLAPLPPLDAAAARNACVRLRTSLLHACMMAHLRRRRRRQQQQRLAQVLLGLCAFALRTDAVGGDDVQVGGSAGATGIGRARAPAFATPLLLQQHLGF